MVNRGRRGGSQQGGRGGAAQIGFLADLEGESPSAATGFRCLCREQSVSASRGFNQDPGVESREDEGRRGDEVRKKRRKKREDTVPCVKSRLLTGGYSVCEFSPGKIVAFDVIIAIYVIFSTFAKLLLATQRPATALGGQREFFGFCQF